MVRGPVVVLAEEREDGEDGWLAVSDLPYHERERLSHPLIRRIVFLFHQHPHTHAGPSSESYPHTNHTFDNLHDSLSHPNKNEPHYLGSPTMPTLPELDLLFHRNERFEQLISGRESEIGEAPPAYCRVVPVLAV
jgi:hypothetical protein